MDWLRHTWSRFPVGTRVSTGVLLALIAFTSVWAVNGGNRDGWVRIIDGGSTLESRGQMVERLQELGIETQVRSDSISVRASKAEKAMLHLHSAGALGDNEFFKFLKETDLFSTGDRSNRQWLVAIQGHLAAMIQSLNYVRTARVQIAEPADPKSLWWANGRETTAAVVLEPKPNETLNSARARSIALLLSGAIPGLKPSGVKILDQHGRSFVVSEDAYGGDLRDTERMLAAEIEKKALDLLPPDSRVAAQVRLTTDKGEIEKTGEGSREKKKVEPGQDYKSISLAALIPEEARGVPPEGRLREEFVKARKDLLRTASGARLEDISILVGPLSIAEVKGVEATPLPAPETPWIRNQMAVVLLALVGCCGMAATWGFVRRMKPSEEPGVVMEESLRAPGESILSAQDETFNRIRTGVRQSVSRNPREAAEVARRWLSP